MGISGGGTSDPSVASPACDSPSKGRQIPILTPLIATLVSSLALFTPSISSKACATGNGPQPGPPRRGDGNILLGKGQFNYPVFCFVTTQERAAQTQKAPHKQTATLPWRFPELGPRSPQGAKRGRERRAHGNDGVKAKPQNSRFFNNPKKQEKCFCCPAAMLLPSSK